MPMPLRKSLSAALVLLLLLGWCAHASAATHDDSGSSASAKETKEAEKEKEGIQHTPAVGITMLALLFAAFFAMTRYNVPLPLAMTLVACAFLAFQWGKASEEILRAGFFDYAPIVILFTAVAIPAHQVERSNGFRWMAAYLAMRLSRFRIKH